MIDPNEILGYEQITDISSAVSLTLPSSDQTGRGPTVALIQSVGQAVRWRDDGTAPTATVGMHLAAGDTLEYRGNLNNIQFFQESASAELNISYYTE